MEAKKIFQISLSVAIFFFIGIIVGYFLSLNKVDFVVIKIKTIWSICIYAWVLSFIIAIIFGIRALRYKKFQEEYPPNFNPYPDLW